MTKKYAIPIVFGAWGGSTSETRGTPGINAGCGGTASVDAQEQAEREAYRSILADMGRRGAEALQEFDRACRDLDLGITDARDEWDALSEREKRELRLIAAGTPSRCAVRAWWGLSLRGLVTTTGRWPRARMIATERGQFVLKMGDRHDDDN